MARKTPSSGPKINLAMGEETHAHLDQLAERFKWSKKDIAERAIEWLEGQDELLQGIILGIYPEQLIPDVKRHILDSVTDKPIPLHSPGKDMNKIAAKDVPGGGGKNMSGKRDKD